MWLYVAYRCRCTLHRCGFPSREGERHTSSWLFKWLNSITININRYPGPLEMFKRWNVYSSNVGWVVQDSKVQYFALRSSDCTQISEILRGLRTQINTRTHRLPHRLYTELQTRSPTFLSAGISALIVMIDPEFLRARCELVRFISILHILRRPERWRLWGKLTSSLTGCSEGSLVPCNYYTRTVN